MSRKEIHTPDMPVRQPPPIVLPDEGELDRVAERIIPVDTLPATDYMEELAFMEEPVTIRLHRSNEKNAPAFYDFYVNGRVEWVPVEQNYTLARKYVEVIARTQPYNVETKTGTAFDERPANEIVRHQSAKHPFSVIRDPNPRGADWLMRVMAES